MSIEKSPSPTNALPPGVTPNVDSVNPETAGPAQVIQEINSTLLKDSQVYGGYEKSNTTLSQTISETPGEFKRGQKIVHGPAPGDVNVW